MAWIDFKTLREKLDFSQVLAYYKGQYKRKGDRATAFCPLPGHRGRRRSPSFSADLKRGLFQCFGCGEKGNVLEFACLMEQVDPQNSKEFHRVAAELEERFVGPPGKPDGQAREQRRDARPAPPRQNRTPPERQ